MLMLPAAPIMGPPTCSRRARLLVVGGPDLARCRVAGQLGPRGYEIERVPEIGANLDVKSFDVVVFALPAAKADAVVAWCAVLHGPAAPSLLVLHAANDAGSAIRVLDAGADDCLLAPHNLREVEARVRALLRRRDRRMRPGRRHLVFDGLRLDAERRRVESRDGSAVVLTESQHRLLAALLARPREVVSREELIATVLGQESDAFDRAIDVHVSRLKKRLAQISDLELITAYRGVGYRIEVSHVTP
jgi:two-component system OmpR family response regulator